MQNSWKAYFIFSKKEQRGIMVLGLLLLGSVLVGIVLPHKNSVEDNYSRYGNKNGDRNRYVDNNGNIKNNEDVSETNRSEPLFYFDPNTIDSSSALRLGIPPRQIATLLRYRNRGGRFYQKEDIGKLYGLRPALIEKLIPFVSIKNKVSEYNFKGYKRVGDNWDENTGKEGNWTIDINTADEREWQLKTKVSPKVIQHILKYRNYLGGFAQTHQISKVYGMTVLDYSLLRTHLRVSNKIKLLPNANTIPFNEWKRLDIFQDQEIMQIMQMRKQNGGRIGWRALVIRFDLTPAQAEILKTALIITD